MHMINMLFAFKKIIKQKKIHSEVYENNEIQDGVLYGIMLNKYLVSSLVKYMISCNLQRTNFEGFLNIYGPFRVGKRIEYLSKVPKFLDRRPNLKNKCSKY